MVDWNSPEILRLSLLLFRQTAVFILGSYIWYIALTFKDVELRLILGRMTFRVAHIPYFLARYMNACELLTIVLSSYIPRTVHSCGPVALPIIITAVSGNVALAASSTNIAFRVIVLWKHHKWVSQLLAVICVVDISLAVLLGAFSVDSLWDDEHQFCVISAGRTQRGLLSLYCFTVVWHIVILILTFIGIRRSDVLAKSSPLLSMLYQQSLGYAVLMCVTCIPMAIIVYLNLNSIVNVLPALVGTTIAVMTSSSAVTSLFRLNDSSPNSSTSTIPQPRRVPRRQQRGRRHRTDNELANPEDAEKADSITSPTARPQRSRQLGLSDFLSDSDSDIEYGYGSDEDEEDDDVEAGALTTHINIGSTSEFRNSDDIVIQDVQDVHQQPHTHIPSVEGVWGQSHNPA